FLELVQLKKQLKKEGLFEEADKKTIAAFPEHIAIITSETGAAIRDMVTTIKRRYTMVHISSFTDKLQEQGSEYAIAAAISQVNHYPEKIDSILLARGGGSIEDLWSFNMERVIRAVYNSSIPIISGVGHETDTTLTDFAADLRAPTPTGAAELAVPSITELHYTVAQSRVHLNRFIQEKTQYVDRLQEACQRQLTLIFSQKREQNKQLQQRLIQTHPRKKISNAKQELDNLTASLTKNRQQMMQQKRQQLQTMLDKLALLNPLYIMNKGFSVAYKQDGTIVKRTNQVQLEEHIDVAL